MKTLIRLGLVFCVTAALAFQLGCGKKTQNPQATITMDDGKQIVIELLPDKAPNTVANFISLAQAGYYDGLTFHRIVPTFVIQGGDPDGDGTGGPGYYIPGEFSMNGFTQNDLSHNRGVISMARANHPDSAGSQFFIVVDDRAIPSLDGLYAGFGRVTEGMDVVDEIVNGERTGPRDDEAVTPRVMTSVVIDTFGATYEAPEVILP